MAGDLKNRKFIENEVKPFIRVTLPEILKRLDEFENLINDIYAGPEVEQDPKGEPAVDEIPDKEPESPVNEIIEEIGMPDYKGDVEVSKDKEAPVDYEVTPED